LALIRKQRDQAAPFPQTILLLNAYQW
jgi:hypothetical protein